MTNYVAAYIQRFIHNGDDLYSQTDILVVGCDLITDLDLNQVANVHRKHNASVTVLLSKLPESGDLPTPGQKGKSEPGYNNTVNCFK